MGIPIVYVVIRGNAQLMLLILRPVYRADRKLSCLIAYFIVALYPIPSYKDRVELAFRCCLFPGHSPKIGIPNGIAVIRFFFAFFSGNYTYCQFRVWGSIILILIICFHRHFERADGYASCQGRAGRFIVFICHSDLDLCSVCDIRIALGIVFPAYPGLSAVIAVLYLVAFHKAVHRDGVLLAIVYIIIGSNGQSLFPVTWVDFQGSSYLNRIVVSGRCYFILFRDIPGKFRSMLCITIVSNFRCFNFRVIQSQDFSRNNTVCFITSNDKCLFFSRIREACSITNLNCLFVNDCF